MYSVSNLETLLVLNRALKSIYNALKLSLEELIQACSFKFDFVEFLEGTDLVVVRQRDRAPGYIYVSDLSTFIYCPRRFYLAYRVANIVDKIKFRKIREKLLQLKPELRECILYDRENFRRILVGVYLHRCVENAFKFLKLPKTYRVEEEIVDEDLGLIGHVDLIHVRYLDDEEYAKCLVETNDEEYCEKPRATVYEVKSGLYKEIPEGYKRQAQLYAFLLERKHGYVIENVYIIHPMSPHEAEKNVHVKLVKVQYNKDTAKELLELVRQARRTLLMKEPPKVPLDRTKCDKCPYKLVCLY